MITIDIKIDKDSGVPLYLQVKKKIMSLINGNKLKVGEKMPTERELSENLKVSRNTISTAYNELEQEGVLKSYQGRGTFVAEEANPWKVQNIKQKVMKFIDLGFEEAIETGMDADEFLEIVTQRVREKKELMSKITAVYVECNIEQARMFSKQIMESTNMNVIPFTLDDIRNISESTKEIVEKSQVIIATFNHVNEVVKLTKKFQKEIIGVAINVDLETIVKIARYPKGTKFAFVCISNEFMFKARGALEKAGLGDIDIQFTNSTDKQQIIKIINSVDVIIVSPGRYEDVQLHNVDNKCIMKFLYNLDDSSVKALKSKIIEIKDHK
ncbi:GntR family transcriptional regulator [Clostridium luticellarii]|uniref:HTH-type transcriptional repressor YtrA n=1 Tax=Clostridium luticellarii TaxID=1691940 RepID=A0A2T0BSB2_9CLOT|nr:GntR family transcriptional regulator [Clostridium luticellarii]MCI1944723.1 GntR family transcriptional regulator [Clostridium luticellarii]MCI1968220.1 GntR family transcriptional regulator [Clostridium luticellarii]MCI1995235.1 GntR family transcriptional regulator [Clostridium luticellarii]MCI2039768.1 GntR family transcriptional regulator [Clostridium luticellarii]PRR86749.1 HTH-type transcriptional repressor YtrA [Clostridium luticellarii]